MTPRPEAAVGDAAARGSYSGGPQERGSRRPDCGPGPCAPRPAGRQRLLPDLGNGATRGYRLEIPGRVTLSRLRRQVRAGQAPGAAVSPGSPRSPHPSARRPARTWDGTPPTAQAKRSRAPFLFPQGQGERLADSRPCTTGPSGTREVGKAGEEEEGALAGKRSRALCGRISRGETSPLSISAGPSLTANPEFGEQ